MKATASIPKLSHPMKQVPLDDKPVEKESSLTRSRSSGGRFTSCQM
jgi:hypothetical protein